MTRHIVFLDRDTVPAHLTIRAPSFEHTWTNHPRTAPEQVVERLAGADLAVVNKVRITGEMIAQLPKLKMIAIAATGYDNIDIAACREAGIVVSNVRGYAINTVPEHTFALILALRRSVLPYSADVVQGKWQQAGQFCFFDHPIADLAGSRLGIFGEGILGSRVAQLGRAFSMDVVFAAHKGRADMTGVPAPEGGFTPFQEVVETSDVITLHCPLLDSTRGLIGAAEFAQMKKKPLLVNTARGGLVDEAALEHALDEGLIAGAAFDVTTPEPPPADHRLMKLAARRSNFILTPHVAWASFEAISTLCDQVIDHLENFVAGKPSNTVT
ncbi:MAG: D-2-hydroxyacid dehydrogenase [Pseudomonadota bacterium]